MGRISNFISFLKRGFKPKLIEHIPGERRTYQYWNGKLVSYRLDTKEGENYVRVKDIFSRDDFDFRPMTTEEPLYYSSSDSFFSRMEGYGVTIGERAKAQIINHEIKANGRVIYSAKHGGKRSKTIDELENHYPREERDKLYNQLFEKWQEWQAAARFYWEM